MSNYRFDSILDIIGPEMIGPSSSHTAGAVRIGLACKSILNDKLLSVRIRLYNSFAETGSGHGTRKALLAGLMGFSKADKRIKNAEQIFKLKKIKYSIEKIYKPNNYPPNTAVINMSSKKWDIEVIGESIGGGLIRIKEIDGFAVNITGDNETLIITHKDRIGILSEILNVLSLYKLNIVTINSVRHNKLDDIKTIITFDNFINPRMRSILTSIQDVVRTRIIHKIQEKWQ